MEQLVAKGYEVIFFTDAVDEYMMQNMKDYDDFAFQNASKEDLKLDDKDSKGKKAMKKMKVRGAPGCVSISWGVASLRGGQLDMAPSQWVFDYLLGRQLAAGCREFTACVEQCMHRKQRAAASDCTCI